jgi:ribosomal protein S7
MIDQDKLKQSLQEIQEATVKNTAKVLKKKKPKKSKEVNTESSNDLKNSMENILKKKVKKNSEVTENITKQINNNINKDIKPTIVSKNVIVNETTSFSNEVSDISTGNFLPLHIFKYSHIVKEAHFIQSIVKEMEAKYPGKIIIKTEKTKLKNEKYILHPLKRFKIPKHILNFPTNKRYYLYNVRFLYLTLSEFSENYLQKLKQYVERVKYNKAKINKVRNNRKLHIVDFPKKLNVSNFRFNREFNSLELYSYLPYNLIINKLANIMMKHGKKEIALRILLDAFEILKRELHISDPIDSLAMLLFSNMVPMIKTKTIGFKNKKLIGIPISTEKRISITFKTFVKGITQHKMPVVYGFITEFFNLIIGKSYLHTYNVKILKEIQEHKLFKYLGINIPKTTVDEEEILLQTKIKPEIEGFDTSENAEMTLSNLLKIDWDNFNEIVFGLKIINLYEICEFQSKILNMLKEYVITKYILNNNSKVIRCINQSLIEKYDLKNKHKVVEFSFLDPQFEYLKKISFEKNSKFIFSKGIPIKEKPLTKMEIVKNLKNRALKLVIENIEDHRREVIDEDKFVDFNFFGFNSKFSCTGHNTKLDFFKNHPDYPGIYITLKVVNAYRKANLNNFNYFPCFVYELFSRLNENVKANLSEEDFLMLFIDKNENLINLELDKEQFIDIPEIYDFFDYWNFWTPTGEEVFGNQDVEDSLNIDKEISKKYSDLKFSKVNIYNEIIEKNE